MSARVPWLLLAAALVVAGGTAIRLRRSEPGPGNAGAADTAVVSRSIVWLEGRLASDPGNTEVAGRLATRYVLRFGTGANLADVRRAEASARTLVAMGTDSVAALSRLSGILLMQHEFAGALDAAQRALDAEPSSAEALGAFADAALATGRTREGQEAIGRLPARSLGTLVRRAQWLEAAGKSAGAYALLDRVCRTLERSAARPHVVAWCLTELARSARLVAGADAARDLYERAVAALPGYRGAVEGLANQSLERGDWRDAERGFRRILSDAHPDLYLRMADIAMARGRRRAAQQWEAEFLRVAAVPAAEALYGPPLALYFAGRDDRASQARALAIAEREVARRPTAESWDLLAWTRFRAGDQDGALQAVRGASERAVASVGMAPYRARILGAMRAARGA